MTPAPAASPPPRPSPPPPAALPGLFQGRRRLQLVGLLANHLLQAGLAVAVAWQLPALVRQLTAADAPHLASGPWFGQAAWAAALLLGLGALRHLSLAQGEALAQHYIAHVRLRLFDRLASLSPGGQHRRSRGGVMLRFVGDVQALRAWVGTGIAQCVAGACALTALLAALAWWSPLLGLTGLAGCLLAAGAMWLTLPRLTRTVRDSRRRQAQIAANIHDRINHLQRMQAAGSARRERRRLGQQNRRLRQALLGRAWAQALHRSVLDLCILGLGAGLMLVSLSAAVGAAGTGGLLWSATPGSGGLWAGVVGLLGLLATPLRGVGLALESRAAAGVARERMLDFLAEPQRLNWARQAAGPHPAGQSTPRRTAPRSAAAAPPAPGSSGAAPALDMALQGAGVPGRLRPLTAELPWGTHLAVLGAAGSGKTTLAALLVRLEDPAQGRVLAGGRPLPQWTEARWRRQVSHLSARPAITRGSLGHFLRQRCPQATDAQLQQACALAGWPDLQAADMQLLLRDGGAPLNDQRQRQLALAAALLGPPAVLVIDDAEHALPGPAAQTLAGLLQRFQGSLLYTTAQPELAALAPQRWTLQPAQPLQAAGVAAQAATHATGHDADEDEDDSDSDCNSADSAPARAGSPGRPASPTSHTSSSSRRKRLRLVGS